MRGGWGGAVGPAACWRPFRRRGVFCSRGSPGSLWAYSCQRSALHHSAASTREQRGPRTCWGWDEVPESPPPRSRHALCRDRPPPPPRAGPSARWTAWGSAGDTWARRKAEERGFAAAAPSRLQFAVRFVAAAGECGNRSGAGSSGEAAGLLHIRVLTPRLVSPSFRPAPLPRPRPMTRPTAPPASGNLGAH